jgi:hypothetical protein
MLIVFIDISNVAFHSAMAGVDAPVAEAMGASSLTVARSIVP